MSSSGISPPQGFAARCVHVIADLGVADRIDDSHMSVNELASAGDVDADALDRVMHLLAAHGIFDHRDGTFGHTTSSRLLRSDHPMTMPPFVQMMGLPIYAPSRDARCRHVSQDRLFSRRALPVGLTPAARRRSIRDKHHRAVRQTTFA